MNDRAALLAIDLAAEVGGLQVRDLFLLAATVAGDAEFTAPELVSHATVPENSLLRNAIVATCAELSPRRLGQLFARWKGVDLAGLRIDAIGTDAGGILWKLSVAQPCPNRTAVADASTLVALPLGKTL